ncbi:MAG: portal protein, partial [Thermodesulfobacteriota bacterium]
MAIFFIKPSDASTRKSSYTSGEVGFLREGGYEEFPFMVPRWDVSGADVYGRSPGMDCLADVKMLNDVCKSLVKGVHKGVDPPMLVP